MAKSPQAIEDTGKARDKVAAQLGIGAKKAEHAAKVVTAAVRAMPAERNCKCGSALAHALITDRKAIPELTRKKLELLVGKYL